MNTRTKYWAIGMSLMLLAAIVLHFTGHRDASRWISFGVVMLALLSSLKLMTWLRWPVPMWLWLGAKVALVLWCITR
jgi:hypothetical protein